MDRCQITDEGDRRWEKTRELSAHRAFVWRSTDRRALSELDPAVVPWLRQAADAAALRELAEVYRDAFGPLAYQRFLDVAERYHGVAMLEEAGLHAGRPLLEVVRCAQPDVAPLRIASTTSPTEQPEVSTVWSACS